MMDFDKIIPYYQLLDSVFHPIQKRYCWGSTLVIFFCLALVRANVSHYFVYADVCQIV